MTNDYISDKSRLLYKELLRVLCKAITSVKNGQEIGTGASWRKTRKWPVCKLKPARYAPHPLERLELKADSKKCWCERGAFGTLTLLVGLWNCTTTLESSMAVSYKGKHKLGVWPSNFSSRYSSKKNENTHSKKFLYTNVHSIVSHDSLKLEHQQISG